jgi:hypothetical protein
MLPTTSTILTEHACRRMQQRGIRFAALEACLAFGRRISTQGAVFLVMGRKEAARARRNGIRLDNLTGLQVLVVGGTVVTVYRNARAFPHREVPFRRSGNIFRNAESSRAAHPSFLCEP